MHETRAMCRHSPEGKDALQKEYEVYEILGVDYNKYKEVLLNSEEYKPQLIKKKVRKKTVKYLLILLLGEEENSLLVRKGKL